MNRLINSSIQLSLDHAKKIYAVMIIMVIVALAFMPSIQIDTDPENMLPADNPARVFHNQTKSDFLMHDSIVVGAVQTEQFGVFTPTVLKEIEQLTKHILSIEGVIEKDVMSVSVVDNVTQEKTEFGSNAIRFEWLMKQAPESQKNAYAVLEKIKKLPLLNNTLASENGNAVAIYVPLEDKNKSYLIAQEIQTSIDSFSSSADWHITGLPVAEDRFGYEMFVQMGISAPLAGLAIFILLFILFKNIKFISAAMIVAMTTVIVTMGLLIGLGYTVHIMSSMIAIFLMPIAVVDSVHIMSEFADRYKEGQDKKAVIKTVVGELFTPMLFTSVTSTIGFLSLMLTPIPPVQIFGAFIGFGIILAFVTTILFVPAYISRLSDKSLKQLQDSHQQSLEQKSGLAAFVNVIGNIAKKRQALHIVIFGLIFIWSAIGVTKIQINDNPVRWFKEDHPIRVADKELNQQFAGTYDAYFVLQDESELPSVKALLEGSEVPVSLIEWHASQLQTSLSSDKSVANQLNTLVYEIEDMLFEVSDKPAILWLESKLESIEIAQQKSKRFTSPEVLTYIENLQNYLATTGLVGKSNSLADIVKVVNRELRSGEIVDYQLPDSANGVAQTLIQYQSSHRPGDLWHFVTPDYRKSLVWLQLTSGDNQHMSSVIESVEQYIKQNPLPDNISTGWAGKAYLNVAWQEQMVTGMLDSLMSAFVIVFIMMILLFRSFVYGLLAMLPLTITITFIYGLIGWIGKDYDMPIAVLSALTLGLSVDFAIHFLERARSALKETGSIKQTMNIMFGEPANAITKNASVVALGFTPLLFAPLVPYVTVGVFLASIMAISALVTLILLPAVLTIIKRGKHD